MLRVGSLYYKYHVKSAGDQVATVKAQSAEATKLQATLSTQATSQQALAESHLAKMSQQAASIAEELGGAREKVETIKAMESDVQKKGNEVSLIPRRLLTRCLALFLANPRRWSTSARLLPL